MARFFLQTTDIQGDKVVISGDDAYHIARVLRLKPGDKIEASAGTGETYVVQIDVASSDSVEGQIIQRFRAYQEPPIPTILYQGLAKGDKMDWVIQKAVELGAAEIVPFTSRYTVVKMNPTQIQKRLQRWQRIAEEAAKQCQRDKVPLVRPVVQFSELIGKLNTRSEDEVLLMPYEHEERRHLRDITCEAPRQISIIIGPEGGFHPEEVAEATGVGAHIITLGPRILRTETAGIVALSLVGYRWGDLG